MPRGIIVPTGRVAVAIFCCMSLMMGCSRGKEGALTFSVGGAPSELDFWETLISEFQKETGIEVDLLRQPTDSDQRRQGLVVALDARKGDPDVFLMDVVWIPQFAASGWLQPLDEFAGKNEVALDAFFANVVKLADTYHGALLALPVYVDAGLLYYRSDLLKRFGLSGPPATWDELVTYSLAIQKEMRRTNPGFYGFVWQGAQYEGLMCNFLEFAGSHGGGIAVRNSKIVLDSPENRTALQFMRDLIHRYKISPPNTYTEMREEPVRLAFQRGEALFERNWPYAWALHQSAGSGVKGETGIALLPHFRSYPSVSTLGGWHIGISKYSDAKPSSWKLVQYVVSYRIQKRLALGLGWNPGRKDIYRDEEVLEKMPHLSKLERVFQNAVPRPALPYYTQLSAVIQRHLNAALAGNRTPEAALAAAQSEAQRIVDWYETE